MKLLPASQFLRPDGGRDDGDGTGDVEEFRGVLPPAGTHVEDSHVVRITVGDGKSSVLLGELHRPLAPAVDLSDRLYAVAAAGEDSECVQVPVGGDHHVGLRFVGDVAHVVAFKGVG